MTQVPGAGFTALVIEDEPLIALDIEDMLIDCGARRVISAGDFAAAQERMAGPAVHDVILFDLDLGGMSTVPLVEDAVSRGIGAILISGSDALPDALSDRDIRLLTKPLDMAALREALTGVGLSPST